MPNAGKNESVSNISAPSDAYEPFAEWCERRRMVKRSVLGDILKWFMAQPDAAKAAVLNIVDEGMEDSYAKFLEDFAKQIRRRKP